MKWKLGIVIFFFGIGILPICSQHLYFEKVTGLTENPSTQIHGIAKDSVGYLWFGTWNGVYRYDGKNFDEYRHVIGDSTSLPNNRIRNIILDQNKSLWLLSFDRECVKYNYSLNRFEVIPNKQVPELVVSLLNNTSNQINRNEILAGKTYYLSSHKLIEQDRISGDLYTYAANPEKPGGLSDAYITSFFIDNQEILWLGTQSGDIYKANTKRKPFNIHSLSHQRPEEKVYSTVRSILKNKQELWIGTNNNGVEIYENGQVVSNHPYKTSLNAKQQVRTLYKDSIGNIWIGGTKGLDVYMPESQQIIPIINRVTFPGLRIYSVYAIKEFKRSIWVGLYNGVAHICLPDFTVKMYNLEGLIHNHSIMDLLFDKNDMLWLATEGNGIIRLSLNAEGALQDTLQFNSSLKNWQGNFWGDMAYSLYEDAVGNVWAATTDGLFRVDTTTKEIEHFAVSEGLPDNYIAAITGDENGNIWISHKKGISKLNTKTQLISNYQVRDKNKDWTFMDRAVFKDNASKQIYFGSRDGYVSFKPDDIKTSTFEPKIILKSLSISGNRVDPEPNKKSVLTKVLSQTKGIKLAYSNRDFSIEMAALHYNNTSDNLIYYKMEGYTDKWTAASQNRVSFNKVPSGQYIFKAKAISPDHVSSPVVSLEILISPPWYFSKVAFVLYTLITLLLLYAIYRFVLYRERLKNELQLEKVKVEKQEELNRQKLEFFTNISHDLRTPLTLIADPIKRLQQNNLDDKKRSVYLSMISRNVSLLTQQINQLLDFRKAEAGKLIAKYAVDDVVEIIQQNKQAFDLKATERNIALNFTSDTSEFVANIDMQKINQILSNLVSNALKYTPNNGEITISLETENNDKKCIVSVKDNGVGINNKALKRIFEPFNNEGVKPFYGYSSGMGLALTHKLVEVLNGKITIESAPKKGTSVYVTLPLQRAESVKPSNTTAKNEIHKTKEAESETDKKHKKPLVLIVEDSIDVQTYLKAELEETYEIHIENNGLDGYKSTLKNIPDLIVSDVMMPKMDGITFCDKVKNTEQSSHIPIILLTAKTSDESQVEGLKTGADMYVSKPFNMDVLKAQVESLLENRNRLQSQLGKAKYVTELGKGENQRDNEFILKTIAILKKHLDNPELNPDKLAEQLNISRRQLYRKLMAISGSTVQDFIVRVKMEKATELLLKTALSIAEIADQLGYSEPSNFSRTFTKHFGQSPTKYRKLHTN